MMAVSVELLRSLHMYGYYGNCLRTCMIYRIRGIIGESNIWRFTLKLHLARFLIGGFEYCVERNTCYSLNGVHLIWRYLRDLPNRQIKANAKYTTYTVISMYETFNHTVEYNAHL